MSHVPPHKDESRAHPVPTAWRATVREVISALAGEDYRLARRIDSVASVRAPVSDQMRSYLADFGETLVELPDEAWSTSVSQWMGTHWELVVDLWTAESGASDLVLRARVYEDGAGFRIELDSIMVP